MSGARYDLAHHHHHHHSAVYPTFAYPPPSSSSSSTSSSSASASVPTISPYVTPYAPQNPLYLDSDSTPTHPTPALVYPRVVPPDTHLVYPHPHPPASASSSSSSSSHSHRLTSTTTTAAATPPYPVLHPALAARTPACFGVPCRADDSGYVSPGVPSPHATLTSGGGGSGSGYSLGGKGAVVSSLDLTKAGRRYYYSRAGVEEGSVWGTSPRRGRWPHAGAGGGMVDTDEENDKEVEQVFSKAKVFYKATAKAKVTAAAAHSDDWDSGASLSD